MYISSPLHHKTKQKKRTYKQTYSTTYVWCMQCNALHGDLERKEGKTRRHVVEVEEGSNKNVMHAMQLIVLTNLLYLYLHKKKGKAATQLIKKLRHLSKNKVTTVENKVTPVENNVTSTTCGGSLFVEKVSFIRL